MTQAETIAAHRRLREDLWRSALAYYVVELVDAFTQEADPNALVFDLLLETLGRLDDRMPIRPWPCAMAKCTCWAWRATSPSFSTVYTATAC